MCCGFDLGFLLAQVYVHGFLKSRLNKVHAYSLRNTHIISALALLGRFRLIEYRAAPEFVVPLRSMRCA